MKKKSTKYFWTILVISLIVVISVFFGVFGQTVFGTQQTMVGATEVEPNTQQIYSISLSTTVPDSNWSDGTYQVQYANWALTDKDGNIKQQGSWETVNGSYVKNITITTPSYIGDFILLAVITQYDMTYDYTTHSWTTSEEKIMNKEAINIKNKYVVIAPTNPTAGGFAKFWNSIVNFFKNLFGWL